MARTKSCPFARFEWKKDEGLRILKLRKKGKHEQCEKYFEENESFFKAYPEFMERDVEQLEKNIDEFCEKYFENYRQYKNQTIIYRVQSRDKKRNRIEDEDKIQKRLKRLQRQLA